MKSQSIKEQRLDALESEFGLLLMSCLEECANGRYGLFGQNDSPELAKYYHSKDGDRLKQTALQIRSLRAEFGRPNLLVERFLYFCSVRTFPVSPSSPEHSWMKFAEVISNPSRVWGAEPMH
jgi:hypothetical protein